MKYIRSRWFLLRFYLYIFVFLVLRLPYFKRMTDEERRTDEVFKAVHKWASYSVKIGKSDVKVYGTERIPRDRPVLFISNHESYADIPMLVHALKDFNFGFLLKSTMNNIPFIKDYLEYMGCVSVDQTDMRQAVAALNSAAELIKSGRSMLIFPEGKRSFNNIPREFKNGAFKLVRKTGVTVVPIYIHNVHLVYEGNERCIAPADVTITVLDPIETAEMTRDDVKKLNETVYNIIVDYAKESE